MVRETARRWSVDDKQVLDRIKRLVDEEQELLERREEEQRPEDHQRLEELQVGLDQCWDYLRQRRALRAAGRDPETAGTRPLDVVEKYEQ
jgi:hypothetical protein